jgi:hypothetical protein
MFNTLAAVRPTTLTFPVFWMLMHDFCVWHLDTATAIFAAAYRPCNLRICREQHSGSKHSVKRVISPAAVQAEQIMWYLL